jgi:spore germination protein GerM
VERELSDGVATVSVTPGFPGLSGGNQLLAVAQVVWTLTELPTVTAVRFSVDGTPVEIPTDDGLTDRPVDRDDYRSVKPIEASRTTTSDQQRTTAGTTTPR